MRRQDLPGTCISSLISSLSHESPVLCEVQFLLKLYKGNCTSNSASNYRSIFISNIKLRELNDYYQLTWCPTCSSRANLLSLYARVYFFRALTSALVANRSGCPTQQTRILRSTVASFRSRVVYIPMSFTTFRVSF